MRGKVVLITGAKGGLGTFVTQRFLSAGARVIGISRTIKQSDFPGENFTAISSDITQSNATAELVSYVLQKFGQIDVLVHVMGGFAAAPIHETDDATWASMRDLNLTSPFNILRAVIPAMREKDFGRVVVVGSLAAVEPHATLGAYTASKVAAAALVQITALENRDRGITANVVLPGTMDTPANRAAMPSVDPKTWVQPDDVADAIFAFADDARGQLTGAMLPVYPRHA